ncbi:MAG: NAD(P)/FAD-dependent oxidoreductase [Myxococcota bacterium]
MPERTQVAIIGGGPTGCAAAAYLARGGVDALIIDRDDPPAVQVGESLLPVCAPILLDLGVDMSGFAVKHGATFVRDGAAVRFPFGDALRVLYPHAWQTPRAQLDQRMREAALRDGARFLHASVSDVELPGRVITDAGTVECDFVVDAGGRNQFLARKLGLRVRHPWLKNAAQGAWHRGITPQEPEIPGDVAVTTFEGGWFWFIPFADGHWSVGCVTTPDGPRGPNQFEAALALCPDAQVRLANAERVEPFRGASDISVSATAFHGEGFALLGDAATFLDPVFSTGISLGLHAAREFARRYAAGESLEPWEADCRASVAAFEPVVKSFYDGTFLDIALADPARQQATVRQAIISLLAGDVFDPDFAAPRRFGGRFDSIHRMIVK